MNHFMESIFINIQKIGDIEISIKLFSIFSRENEKKLF